MKNKPLFKKLTLWLCFISIPALAVGYFLRDNQDVTEKYNLAAVTKGPLEKNILATGKLEPRQYVEVGAQVSGQVQHIYVNEGDKVIAGQLLLDIDAVVFEAQVQRASAALEVKRAQLQQLQAELELAEVRAKRNFGMHQQRAVSDDVLISSQIDVKVLQSRIQASSAQIKADEAALEGDLVRLSFAKIYAPIDGTVVLIRVRQGQTLNANQNAPLLLKIADLSKMTLRAEVSEADVEAITKGMPVGFSTLGNLERRFTSQVRQILPTPRIVNDVVLYQILIDIDNPDGILMDAMTTQVFFQLAYKENALSVPLSALKGRKKRSFVRVLVHDKLTNIPVKTGITTRTHAEILAGLSADQMVVIGEKSTDKKRQMTRPGAGSGGRGRRGNF